MALESSEVVGLSDVVGGGVAVVLREGGTPGAGE